jgi:hypothetical protein
MFSLHQNLLRNKGDDYENKIKDRFSWPWENGAATIDDGARALYKKW